MNSNNSNDDIRGSRDDSVARNEDVPKDDLRNYGSDVVSENTNVTEDTNNIDTGTFGSDDIADDEL